MTEPIKEILPRNTDKGLQELLDGFSIMIDEVVNYGTHILKRLLESSKGSGDVNMPLAMFFRDMLEKTDSISILVKNSSIDPSKVILRSIFELHLFISYLNEKYFIDRSMAFLVWHTKDKIKMNRSYLKGSQEYKNLCKQMEKDNSFYDKNILEDNQSSKLIIDNLTDLLKKEQYQKALNDYEKTSTKYNNPNWYSLFNGPKNIQQLAYHLNMPFLYETIYRSWSGSVHNTDIINGKIVKSKNSDERTDKVNADMIQIRFPKDAQMVTSNALILMIKTYNVLFDNQLIDKKAEYIVWYMSIREKLFQIANKRQLLKINYQ
jgi:hypothetical protein